MELMFCHEFIIDKICPRYKMLLVLVKQSLANLENLCIYLFNLLFHFQDKFSTHFTISIKFVILVFNLFSSEQEITTTVRKC